MDWLKRLPGRLKFNEPLSRHCTFRIGGKAKAWYEPAGVADLRQLVKNAKSASVPVFIAGYGSNVLFPDRGFDGICFRLSAPGFTGIIKRGSSIVSGAGASLARLIKFARDSGLGGLEFLTGIPGTVGGALVMNAGIRRSLYIPGDNRVQEISSLITEVKVMDYSGMIKRLNRLDIRFGYRKSSLDKFIVLEAAFKLQKKSRNSIESDLRLIRAKRIKRQDYDYPSAGCIFRNPSQNVGAGKLIDDLGLKGLEHGGAAVSLKHANFIINKDKAKAADVLEIIGIIREKVRKAYNIELETEVKIVPRESAVLRRGYGRVG